MTEFREGAVDRFYRRGTEPLAAFLAQRRWITPNRISCAGFIVGGLGAALCILTLPLWTAGVLVGIGDLLDYLDGDVARKQGTGSREGAILDATLDRYTDALAIGSMAYLTADTALPLGLAALFGAMLVPYVRAKTEAEGKTSAPTLGERGMRNRVLVIGLLFNRPVWTLAAIALLTNFSAFHRLTTALRKNRQ